MRHPLFFLICVLFLFTHVSGSFSMSDCNLLQFTLNPAFQFLSHDRFLIFKNSLVVADFYRG